LVAVVFDPRGPWAVVRACSREVVVGCVAVAGCLAGGGAGRRIVIDDAAGVFFFGDWNRCSAPAMAGTNAQANSVARQTRFRSAGDSFLAICGLH
jgi:hypothetical protein